MKTALLRIEDLRITVPAADGPRLAVRGIDLELAAGQKLAVVGESGSGKSLCASAISGLMASGVAATGQVLWRGKQLLGAPERERRALRGRGIGMVFQDPLGALTPHLGIGQQVLEMVRLRGELRGGAARRRVLELLREVELPDPERRVHDYPHRLSGGQLQRVCLAIALAGEPELLIADEPTTALDAAIQGRILELLARRTTERGMALLLISHDLGAVWRTCERVAVMYGGSVMETGPTDAVCRHPAHPYTRSLLEALPRLEGGELPQAIEGAPPMPGEPEHGCPFAPRCPRAESTCHEERPPLEDLGPDRRLACPPARTAFGGRHE